MKTKSRFRYDKKLYQALSTKLGCNPKIEESKLTYSYYNPRTQTIYLTIGHSRNTFAHEFIHAKQHLVDKNLNIFTNYSCILKNDYWPTYFFKPWGIEKEARQLASKVLNYE